MAGHSQYANIKHRKDAQDNKRGKVFQKLSREIYVSVKLNGEKSESNPRLKLLLEKARRINMPKDNINRAINILIKLLIKMKLHIMMLLLMKDLVLIMLLLLSIA